jgi:hypothetical protein
VYDTLIPGFQEGLTYKTLPYLRIQTRVVVLVSSAVIDPSVISVSFAVIVSSQDQEETKKPATPYPLA